jgi:UDP-N-acetylmuramyl pentapeptide phosphotransferase/UDP-N-acetylglucosamine-1-phosphate transferase
MAPLSATLAAAIGFLVVASLTPLVVRAARAWGFLDVPNERSSHVRVTPRGGGVAVVVAVYASLYWLAARIDGTSVVLLAGAGLMALLGLLDDRFGLPVWLRFIAQVVAAAVLVSMGGSLSRLPLPQPLDLPLWPWAAPVTVLWIVVVVNAYNFMDGIDGLAGLQGLVTGAMVSILSWSLTSSWLAAVLAGGCAAFLLFNWSPARIFLGDVGSGFLGFVFAGLPLLAPERDRSAAVLCVALSLWFYLSDVIYTRVKRIMKKHRWFAPHREHLYQRFAAAGSGHARTAGMLGLGAGVMSAAAICARHVQRPIVWWSALMLGVVLLLLEIALVRRAERARSVG